MIDHGHTRVKDKEVQKEYYLKNPYDEIHFGFYREFVPRNDVHEIQHGSSKTYENWNMISLTRENHNISQAYNFPKRKLFIAKILNGSATEFPEEIIRKFDLKLIIKNKEKFKKRWLLKSYHKV